MKDIHNHILFGLDDGCEDLEESIKIIKKAKKAGYTDLILTPHYREVQKYVASNEEKEKKLKLLVDEVKKQKIKMNLYLGNEVTVDDDFFYYLKMNLIMPLNNSRYILLELPFDRKFKELRELFFKLKELNYIPIIAHPERYKYYKNLDEFVSWIEEGVLFQGNSASLYGKYGRRAKKRLEEMLKRHMIHFIGSDIHHQKQTSYENINDIIKKVTELTGNKKMTLELVDENIDKVIKNKKIEAYKVSITSKKLKIFNR